MKGLIFISVVFLVGIMVAVDYQKYIAVKKFYPELSYWEYCLLEDTLRITPNG